MTYEQPNTGDSINDFFINISNFMKIAPSLFDAKDSHTFMELILKLDEIDRRSLILYLRKNRDVINNDYIKMVEEYLCREI